MDDVAIRDLDTERDRSAVGRIWREIGWIEREERHDEALDHFLGMGPGLVAEIDGEAEVCVTTAPGTLRHGTTDLPMCAVSSVTASRLARRGGLASALTARSLAREAAKGSVVAALGAFEQGYYDRLGFGTGAYLRRWRLDPSALRVPVAARRPVRLGIEDADELHANRLAAERRHGACVVTPSAFTAAETRFGGEGFGLGFRDDRGQLTHHVWFEGPEDAEHGPYRVGWFAHRSAAELRDLFGLVRSLGDQILQVDLPEPPGVQVQQLLDRPFRAVNLGSTRGQPGGRQAAWWQCRLLDVPAAVAATHLRGPGVRFTLELDDPVGTYLPGTGPWRGVAGRYDVELGERSSARSGEPTGRPVLRCGVGTFTRLWLGVVPATRLPVTDDLEAPDALLEAIEGAIALPEPLPNFEF